MSSTCSLFPPFRDPWPSCLLPSQTYSKALHWRAGSLRIPSAKGCAQVKEMARHRGGFQHAPDTLPSGDLSHQWMPWPLCSQKVQLPGSWTLQLIALCHTWAIGVQLWEPLGLVLASPDTPQSHLLRSYHLLHPSQGLEPTAHSG